MTVRLETNVTTTPTIEPALQQQLHAALSQYTGLLEQITLLEELASAEKAKIRAILEEAGTDKTSQDGYHIALVRGTTSSLDKKRLLAQGVTEAMIAAATVTKPKQPYITVRKQSEPVDE